MKRIAAVVVSVAAMSAGCVRSPYHASFDRHNFVSTPHMPLTINLVDTLTGETVWTLDVPVNQMAVVDLEHKTDWSPGMTSASPAYKISWDIFDPGAKLGLLHNEQQLSGNPVMLKVAIRDRAEVAAAAPTNNFKAPADAEQLGGDAWSSYPQSSTRPRPTAAPVAPAPTAAPAAAPAPKAAPASTEPLDAAPVPPQPQFRKQTTATSGSGAAKPPAAVPANQQNQTVRPAAPQAPAAPTAPSSPNQPTQPGQSPKKGPLGADDTGK